MWSYKLMMDFKGRKLSSENSIILQIIFQETSLQKPNSNDFPIFLSLSFWGWSIIFQH